MRRSIFSQLRLKLLIILLLPVLGLLFFSSNYLYQNYKKYQESLYLQDVMGYVQRSLALIHALQKERGLSLACLDKRVFCTDLKKQYQVTDRAKEAFLQELGKKSFGSEKLLLEKIETIALLRQKVQQNRITPFETLRGYTAIIIPLIDRLEILRKHYIDKSFFELALAFEQVLRLSEINGQERALIANLLQSDRFDPKLYSYLRQLHRMETALLASIKKGNYILELECLRHLDPVFKKRFEQIKEQIIEQRRFDLLSKRSWWQMATKYIDALFEVQDALLHRLLKEQGALKTKANSALVLSLLFWLLALLALFLFWKLMVNVFNQMEHSIEQEEQQKRFYKTISEFSENILFIDTFNALLNTFVLMLKSSGFFSFVFIQDAKSGTIEVAEGVSLHLINEEVLPQIRRSIAEVKRSGRYKIVIGDGRLCNLCNAYGIFSLRFAQQTRYIAILAIAHPYHFDERFIDLVYKMVELFESAYDRLKLREKERQMQQELRLLSHAFNAHEAITITDASGKILRVNRAFEKITGYKEEEVVGKTPAVLKSGKHDKEFYQKMWDAIKHEGYWKGEIYNKKKDGTIYPEVLAISAIRDENGQITNYIAHFYDISDLKEAQKENEYRANYDLLTDIFNRRRFIEEVEVVRKTALKKGFYCAFFFIDLDNFKYINDSYGHAVGDRVLIEVVNRFKKIAKESDILGRIAGDEFGLVLVDIAEDIKSATKSASIVAKKLLEEYSYPVEIDGISIEISYSIGIFIFPTSEKSAEDIVVNADIAMYHSKKSGKNSFSFYNEELDLESKQFLVMKSAIEEGLRNGEFEIYLQPKVKILDGKVAGFEALLRWDSPKRGLLYPDKFLPYAKGNRLMYELTRFVVEDALQTLQKWEEFDGTISINILAEQFEKARFMDELYSWLDHPKASQIRIELVEDALIVDKEYAIKQIERFKQKGVEFAIDDFGTGYSSLAYLKYLPVKEVKIDKSFVLDLFSDNNDKIVQKTIELAKVFGFEVTAEGVENTKALEALKEFGADYFQGFLFSRAVPKDVARKFIDAAS